MQLGIHYFDSAFLTCLTLDSWAFTPMSESKPCDCWSNKAPSQFGTYVVL